MSGPRKTHNGLTVREYIGTCNLCHAGVYRDDEVVRGRGQLLGVLHAGCARKAAESHAEPRTDRPGTPTNHDR